MLTVLIAALAAIIGAPPALAQELDECDFTVVDMSHDAVLGDASEVSQAAAALELDWGLNVRVIAFEDAPGSENLVNYIKDTFSACGWDKVDTIAYAFEVFGDEYSSVRVSGDLNRTFDQNGVDAIIAVMDDYHRGGLWVDGVVAAIEYTDARLWFDANPPATTQDSTLSQNESSAAWVVLALLGGSVVLVALFIGVARIVAKRRESRKQLEAARLNAEGSLQEATDQLLRINDDREDHVGRHVELTLNGLNPTDSAAITEAWKGAQELIIEAFDANSGFNDEGGARSIEHAKTVEEFKAIETASNEIARKARDARDQVDEVERLCQEVEQRISGLAADYATQVARLQEMRARHTELQQQGYRLPPDTDIDQAASLLEKTQRHSENGEHGIAIASIARAGRLLDHAHEVQETIVRQHEKAEAVLDRASAHVSDVKEYVDTAKQQLHQLAQDFTANCTVDLKQDGAVHNIETALELLGEAKHLASMDAQDFKGSLARTKQAEELLEAAAVWAKAVHQRHNVLVSKSQGLVDELELLKREIAKAKKAIGKMGGKQQINIALAEQESRDFELIVRRASETPLDVYSIYEMIEETRSDLKSALQLAQDEHEREQRRLAEQRALIAAANKPKPSYSSPGVVNTTNRRSSTTIGTGGTRSSSPSRRTTGGGGSRRTTGGGGSRRTTGGGGKR